jgi:hypothetical protein
MMRALSAQERRVLLAHERAHARWFHYLFTSAARLAAAANPLLRPVAGAVGYTVERWADEHAAAVTGNRTLTARAVAQAARAATAGVSPRASAGPAMALGVVPRPGPARPGVFRRGPGPVPLRVAALLRPPPRPQLLLLAVALLLVAVSGLSALEATRDLHGLLELAQIGPR